MSSAFCPPNQSGSCTIPPLQLPCPDPCVRSTDTARAQAHQISSQSLASLCMHIVPRTAVDARESHDRRHRQEWTRRGTRWRARRSEAPQSAKHSAHSTVDRTAHVRYTARCGYSATHKPEVTTLCRLRHTAHSIAHSIHQSSCVCAVAHTIQARATRRCRWIRLVSEASLLASSSRCVPVFRKVNQRRPRACMREHLRPHRT